MYLHSSTAFSFYPLLFSLSLYLALSPTVSVVQLLLLLLSSSSTLIAKMIFICEAHFFKVFYTHTGTHNMYYAMHTHSYSEQKKVFFLLDLGQFEISYLIFYNNIVCIAWFATNFSEFLFVWNACA